jgi:hypothetical protein
MMNSPRLGEGGRVQSVGVNALILMVGRMERITMLLAATVLLLGGCDAWFDRRIDIITSDAASFGVSGASSSSLAGAVRRYAGAHGLPCSESNELPIECYRQPIRIWAVSTKAGAVVCYAAIGIPLERSKFAARMDELESVVAGAFGVASVSSQVGRCPQPPSFTAFTGRGDA